MTNPPPFANPKHARMLREDLAEARAAGIDFAEAWQAAVDRAKLRMRWSAENRQSWLVVFAATRPAWEAAYARQPFAGAEALAELRDSREADDQDLDGAPVRSAA